MRLPIYVIDAFTSEPFKGNPAAVVPLDDWLPTHVMQSIATENNLSETAFFVKNAENKFQIRWFSPLKEVPFCGHATLASAFVIFKRGDTGSVITFQADAVGDLPVTLLDDGMIEMSFPNRAPVRVENIPSALFEGLSIQPIEVLKNVQAYIAVYENEQQVRDLVPNVQRLVELGPLDVAVTARGDKYDFVSRYFWPANGGEEDPVTGSIHAGLAPYWAKRLEKTHLTAAQVSRRTGLLNCRLEGDRVYISGAGVKYLEGVIEV